MRCTLFISLFFILTLSFCAQTEKSFIFRQQEKRVTKNIHKYLTSDTLIETSKAKIHIYYSDDKKKPYLLLLHGMGVDAKTNWYKQVAYLSKYYNLLMPDLIFFGLSETKENNYSVEFQVEQIHEVLKKLNITSKLNVMGFSYGGLATAMYNQLYASEINKLIIIDGPVKFFSLQMADSLAKVAGVASITNIIIPQNLTDFKAMQKAVMSKKLPLTNNLKLKLIRYYFSPTLNSRRLQINYMTDHEAIYQQFTYNLEDTPTLLIWGAKDGVVPLTVGEKLHAFFPKSTQLIVLKKAKHDGHFRYSKKINKAVVSFLGT